MNIGQELTGLTPRKMVGTDVAPTLVAGAKEAVDNAASVHSDVVQKIKDGISSSLCDCGATHTSMTFACQAHCRDLLAGAINQSSKTVQKIIDSHSNAMQNALSAVQALGGDIDHPDDVAYRLATGDYSNSKFTLPSRQVSPTNVVYATPAAATVTPTLTPQSAAPTPKDQGPLPPPYQTPDGCTIVPVAWPTQTLPDGTSLACGTIDNPLPLPPQGAQPLPPGLPFCGYMLCGDQSNPPPSQPLPPTPVQPPEPPEPEPPEPEPPPEEPPVDCTPDGDPTDPTEPVPEGMYVASGGKLYATTSGTPYTAATMARTAAKIASARTLGQFLDAIGPALNAAGIVIPPGTLPAIAMAARTATAGQDPPIDGTGVDGTGSNTTGDGCEPDCPPCDQPPDEPVTPPGDCPPGTCQPPPTPTQTTAPNWCDPSTVLNQAGQSPNQTIQPPQGTAPTLGGFWDGVLGALGLPSTNPIEIISNTLSQLGGLWQSGFQMAQSLASYLTTQTGSCVDGGCMLPIAWYGILNRWVGVSLPWCSEPYRQWQNSLNPYIIPSSGEAHQMYAQNLIDHDTWNNLQLLNAHCTPWEEIKAKLHHSHITLGEAMKLYRRGLLTDQQLRNEGHRWGWKQEPDFQRFLQTQAVLPGLSESVSLASRHSDDDDFAANYGLDEDFQDLIGGNVSNYVNASGADQTYLQMLWRQSRKLPGFGEMRQFLYRADPDNPDPESQFALSDMDSILKAQGWSSYFRELMKQNVYRVMPLRVAQNLYYAKQIEKTDLLKVFANEGYTTDTALKIQKYTDDQRNQRVLQAFGAKSYSKYLSWFSKGYIDQSTMQSVIQGATDDTQTQQTIMQHAQNLRSAALKQIAVAAVKQDYLAGNISDVNVGTVLSGVGIDPAAADAYASVWSLTKAARAKHVSASQACKLYSSGLMGAAEYSQILVRLGYDTESVNYLVSQCRSDLTLKQQKQAQAAAKAESKALAAQQKLDAAALKAAQKQAACGGPVIKCPTGSIKNAGQSIPLTKLPA